MAITPAGECRRQHQTSITLYGCSTKFHSEAPPVLRSHSPTPKSTIFMPFRYELLFSNSLIIEVQRSTALPEMYVQDSEPNLPLKH